MEAGDIEEGREHLGGPFGTVEGNLAVPATGGIVVTGDAPKLFGLSPELMLR